MKLNDVIALANAGFTKSEIANMIANFGNSTPEAPAPEVPAPEAPAPEAPAPENNFNVLFNNLNTKIDTLANAVYSSNIANSRQPKVETSEDVFKFMFGKDEKK